MTEKPNSVCKHCRKEVQIVVLLGQPYWSHVPSAEYRFNGVAVYDHVAEPVAEPAEPQYNRCPKCNGGMWQGRCLACNYEPAEGPQCAKCGCPERHWIHIGEYYPPYHQFVAAPEGTPKLEEAQQKLREWLRNWEIVGNPEANVALHVAMDEIFDKEENADLLAILRPFITPACSPEKSDLENHWEWCKRINVVICGGTPSAAPEEMHGCGQQVSHQDIFRCVDCQVPFHRNCLRKHFNEHVATPASTGESKCERCERNAADNQALASISELVMGYREGSTKDIVDRVEYLVTLEPEESTGEANGWISVEERLPEEMEDVLIWDADEAEGGFCAVTVGWKTDKGWEAEISSSPKVTHWRELPPAPTSVPPKVPNVALTDLSDDALIDWLAALAHADEFWGEYREEIKRRIRAAQAEPKGETKHDEV